MLRFNDLHREMADCSQKMLSQTLKRLESIGMVHREVYPEVGMGYMSTYNRNRFWFRIDHVLYRGNLRPVSMERGKTASSDHYPLLTTFVFD